jgi:hypothetical protein
MALLHVTHGNLAAAKQEEHGSSVLDGRVNRIELLAAGSRERTADRRAAMNVVVMR